MIFNGGSEGPGARQVIGPDCDGQGDGPGAGLTKGGRPSGPVEEEAGSGSGSGRLAGPGGRWAAVVGLGLEVGGTR